MSRHFLVELTGEFDWKCKNVLVEVSDQQGYREAEKEALLECNDEWIRKVNSYRVELDELIDMRKNADHIIDL